MVDRKEIFERPQTRRGRLQEGRNRGNITRGPGGVPGLDRRNRERANALQRVLQEAAGEGGMRSRPEDRTEEAIQLLGGDPPQNQTKVPARHTVNDRLGILEDRQSGDNVSEPSFMESTQPTQPTQPPPTRGGIQNPQGHFPSAGTPMSEDPWHAARREEGWFGTASGGRSYAPGGVETQQQRLTRIANEVLNDQRTLNDVRNSVNLIARHPDRGATWEGYGGPAEGFTGVEGDQFYLDRGLSGVKERVRQIFGNRGVAIGTNPNDRDVRPEFQNPSSPFY